MTCALGPAGASRVLRQGMRNVVNKLTQIGIPSGRISLSIQFHSSPGLGARAGLQPASAWLELVKWKALAAKHVIREYKLHSVWSWGWATYNPNAVDPDKPAAACLASRIAYGVPVSAARLARVEAAELALRQALAAAGLAVRDLRVRDMGDDVARVEVDAALVPAVGPELLAAVDGFARVELDPRGFRSGAMNELLPDPVRYR